MDNKALYAVSYGLYVVAVKDASRGDCTGCVVNTVFQITSEPPMFAVSVNKLNYTHDLIRKEGKLSVTALSQNIDPAIIGTFGFASGREHSKDPDKLLVPSSTADALPYLRKDGVSALEFHVDREIDMGTHTVFMCRLTDGFTLSADPVLTYGYYQTVLKGKSPKLAPTYKGNEKEEPPMAEESSRWVCTVCGYEYDGDTPFEDLPDDWTCPVCGVGKDMFEKQ